MARAPAYINNKYFVRLHKITTNCWWLFLLDLYN